MKSKFLNLVYFCSVSNISYLFYTLFYSIIKVEIVSANNYSLLRNNNIFTA